MNQNYQGDILIISGDKIKEVASKLSFKKMTEPITVAEGEVTGHHHTLVAEPQSEIEFASDEKGYYFKVLNGKGSLTHQEHGYHQLIEGQIYFIGRQYEYNEVEDIKVRD